MKSSNVKWLLRSVRPIALRVYSSILSPTRVALLTEVIFRVLGLRQRVVPDDLTRTKSVVIIRLDEIGDMVLTTPLLRELRRNLPAAWISLVVTSATFNLVEICPYINEVLIYSTPSSPTRRWKQLFQMIHFARRYLWKHRFDMAIVPRWDIDERQATFLACFSGAKRRIGYSEKVNAHKAEIDAGYDALLTEIIQDTCVQHEVERNLHLLEALGGNIESNHLELWTDEADKKYAEAVLGFVHTHQKKTWIALGPTARMERRRWPLENFGELGRRLAEQSSVGILLLGGPGDEQIGEYLRTQIGENSLDLIGKITIRQSFALLERCQIFVGNDSGPMHLAAAAGIPVVELSSYPKGGSPLHFNSPVRFGPWGVPTAILQPLNALKPCVGACQADEAHCIASIPIREVEEAIESLLMSRRETDQ